MKKVFSIVLSVIFIFSCFSLIVFADCDHSYSSTVVPATCADRGYTLHICTSCGDTYKDNYTNALGHNYGAWEVNKEATCTQEGLQTRYCIRCKAAETNTIPVLEHIDADSDGHCDSCGIEMEVETIFAPFDWIVALFKAIANWFAEIFA